jgi:hypothetical protein
MPVKPVLLRDLKRTPVQQHQLLTGSGEYNRWTPLVQRERTFSAGKRKLSGENSNEGGIAGNAAKTPRFDATVVFDQLKGQDAVLEQVKDHLQKFDDEIKTEDNTPPLVKNCLAFLGGGSQSSVKLSGQFNVCLYRCL